MVGWHPPYDTRARRPPGWREMRPSSSSVRSSGASWADVTVQVAHQLVFGEGAGTKAVQDHGMEKRHILQRALGGSGAGQRGKAHLGFGLGSTGRAGNLSTSCGPRTKRAVADQHVAARGAGVEGVAQDGLYHVATIVGRGLRGDQAAGFRRRLGHDDSARQTGDDAVAQGEVAGLRFKSGGVR